MEWNSPKPKKKKKRVKEKRDLRNRETTVEPWSDIKKEREAKRERHPANIFNLIIK